MNIAQRNIFRGSFDKVVAMELGQSRISRTRFGKEHRDSRRLASISKWQGDRVAEVTHDFLNHATLKFVGAMYTGRPYFEKGFAKSLAEKGT